MNSPGEPIGPPHGEFGENVMGMAHGMFTLLSPMSYLYGLSHVGSGGQNMGPHERP